MPRRTRNHIIACVNVIKGIMPSLLSPSKVNRSVVAYWLLGLCNNFGYVVMLSAAHDILAREGTSDAADALVNKDRKCNQLSTGIILLADIIPSLTIKFYAPFIPLWMNVRMILIVASSAVGFILVGMSNSIGLAILGVLCTSFSSGLGESSLLSYTVFYRQTSIISSWSSGTGGAGFFGSIVYALLLSIGISPSSTLFLLLSVPLLMALSFWIILVPPQDMHQDISSQANPDGNLNQTQISHPTDINRDSFSSKIKNFVPALKYIVPLSLVYYFEYLINQGLFELSLIDNSLMSRGTQYRWYQVCYQIGVFISRSSISVIQTDRFWILALLQGLNFAFFIAQSIYLFVPSVLIMFALIVWEGLLGGAAYVNVFYSIQTKEDAAKREVLTGLVTTSDSLGIALAGFTSIPLHNAICKLPLY